MGSNRLRYVNLKCKKSQMEIFGLAVIVVLISIGFFIFIILRNQDVREDPKNDFIADETATNFINSIVNVDVYECYDDSYSVAKMLKYCATKENVRCGGIDPCVLANRTIATILNRTLQKENYQFRLYTEGLRWTSAPNNEINIVNGACTGNDEQGMLGTFPVSLYPLPGHVYINLAICK